MHTHMPCKYSTDETCETKASRVRGVSSCQAAVIGIARREILPGCCGQESHGVRSCQAAVIGIAHFDHRVDDARRMVGADLLGEQRCTHPRATKYRIVKNPTPPRDQK
eukprot:4984732-Pleurochrysis_carterae.AAC.3